MRTTLCALALLAPLAAAAQVYRCDDAGRVTYQQAPCGAGAQRELPPVALPTFEQQTDAALAYSRARALLGSIEAGRAAEQRAHDEARARELRAALARQQREIVGLEHQVARREAERRHRELVDAIAGAGGYLPTYATYRPGRLR